MAKPKKEKTSDGVEILHKRYVRGEAGKLKELESIRASDAVARNIYELRTTELQKLPLQVAPL